VCASGPQSVRQNEYSLEYELTFKFTHTKLKFLGNSREWAYAWKQQNFANPILINLTHNVGLSTVQKARARDKYYTVEKAIRHTMSTISSADGHCQQRNLK